MRKYIVLLILAAVGVSGYITLSGRMDSFTAYKTETDSTTTDLRMSSPAACQSTMNESQLWKERPDDMALDKTEGSLATRKYSIKEVADQDRNQEGKKRRITGSATETLSWREAAISINQTIRNLSSGAIIELSTGNDPKDVFITYVICNETAIISFIRREGYSAVGYYTTSEVDGIWYYVENPSGVTDASLLDMYRLGADIYTYTASEMIFNELLHCKVTSLNKTKDIYMVTAALDESSDQGGYIEYRVKYNLALNIEDGNLEGISYIKAGPGQKENQRGTYHITLPDNSSYYSCLIEVYSRIQSSDTVLAWSLIEIMDKVLEP